VKAVEKSMARPSLALEDHGAEYLWASGALSEAENGHREPPGRGRVTPPATKSATPMTRTTTSVTGPSSNRFLSFHLDFSLSTRLR